MGHGSVQESVVALLNFDHILKCLQSQRCKEQSYQVDEKDTQRGQKESQTHFQKDLWREEACQIYID